MREFNPVKLVKRTVLAGAPLGLLISSVGCSNVEETNTPTPAEPIPISTPIATSRAESAKTLEKEALAHVEYVKNLLGKYINLDLDPRLKRLKDAPYVVLLNKRLFNMGPKELYAEENERVSLAVITSPTDVENGKSVRYELGDLSLYIDVEKQGDKITGETIYFGINEDGNIKKSWEGVVDEVYPDAEALNRKVLSGTEKVSKFLRYKPNLWSVTKDTYPLRVMETTVGLPNGSDVKYSVGTMGDQAIGTFIFIK